jgi:hypothetical protein
MSKGERKMDIGGLRNKDIKRGGEREREANR